jgi:hypothetical protein
LTTGFSTERPNRIWFKIRQKLFAANENGDKKLEVAKKYFLKHLFNQYGIFVKLFLIVSSVNLFDVYCKKRKNFNTLKTAAKVAVVILTAPAVGYKE